MIHAARFQTSSRLRRVHRLLADGRWHSTWDIMAACRVVAVSTAISELRANGAAIACRRFAEEETTEAQIFKYRMTRPVPAYDAVPQGMPNWQGDRG